MKVRFFAFGINSIMQDIINDTITGKRTYPETVMLALSEANSYVNYNSNNLPISKV